MERWRTRIKLADGTRPYFDLPNVPLENTEAAKAIAKVRSAEMAAVIRDRAMVPASTAGETCNEWYKRYYEACERGTVGRKNKGRAQVTAGDRKARYTRYIAPVIGTTAMAAVTPADLRAVVRVLDDAIRTRLTFYEKAADPKADPKKRRVGRKPGLSPKGARNIWGEVTAGFNEAATSKDDALRVKGLSLENNPARDVQPPDAGEKREQSPLYPNELTALLACELVPLYRRRAYALAAYTGLRAGELRGLTAADVDLDHAMINVRRQRKKRVDTARTKTSAGRRQVPIEAALFPLLEILINEAGARPLVKLPPEEDCAELVRKDLLTAGCDREELHTDDEHRMHFTFHGLRHTCITHWAVAGREGPWLLFAAGHTNAEMTRRYTDAASVLRATFGEPHPPLPASLAPRAVKALEGPQPSDNMPNMADSLDNSATPTGIERTLLRGRNTRNAVLLGKYTDPKGTQARPFRSPQTSAAPEDSLRRALDAAINAGRWDVVAHISGLIARSH